MKNEALYSVKIPRKPCPDFHASTQYNANIIHRIVPRFGGLVTRFSSN